MKRVPLTIAIAALPLAALLGCGSAPARPAEPPPKACEPQRTFLALGAGDRLNPSPSGQARPLQVRVYQLKSDAKLRGARFEEVWQEDAATLQGEIVQVDQYTIYPSDTKTIEIAANPAAHTLAAVGLFREPPASGWFLAFDLGSPGPAPTPAEATKSAPLPCPPKERRIAVALDGMQMQDASTAALPSAESGAAGSSESSKDPRGAKGE